jgi:tetratricopeptide (TPR) repeat protein
MTFPIRAMEPCRDGLWRNGGLWRLQASPSRRGLGDLDRAISDFSEAIRLDPKYVRARVNRGRAFIEKLEFDEAVADLTEAIRLDPKFAPAFNHRGWALNEKKSYTRAFADLNEAIRLDPTFAASYNNRGNTYHANPGLSS